MNEAHIWSRAKVNFDTYIRDDYKVRKRAGRRSNLFCDCDDCQLLRSAIEKSRGPSFLNVLKKYNAKYHREKMSIVVDEPGLVHLPNLGKRTDSNFEYIFITEPNKYSFVSLYKKARAIIAENPHGLIDEEMIEAMGGKSRPYAKEQLGTCLSLDKEDGVFKAFHQDIMKTIDLFYNDEEAEEEEDEAPSINFEGVFMINDRYIPYATEAKGLGRNIYQIKEDGFAKVKTIEGVGYTNEESASNYVKELIADKLISGIGATNYDLSSMNSAILFAYDTHKHEFVYGLEILDAVFNLIRENGDRAPKQIRDIVFGIEGTPMEFYNKFKEDFRAAGADEIDINMMVPYLTTCSYNKFDYKTNRNKGVMKQVYCYDTWISRNGEGFIGYRSSSGGYLDARIDRESDHIRLVQSMWCQRVSRWSKYTLNVVDQHYDIWPLADWLTGPFAEKIGIEIGQAKLLFGGAKSSKADRKKKAIQMLKNKLK